MVRVGPERYTTGGILSREQNQATAFCIVEGVGNVSIWMKRKELDITMLILLGIPNGLYLHHSMPTTWNCHLLSCPANRNGSDSPVPP
jgi:hypothetical protein